MDTLEAAYVAAIVAQLALIFLVLLAILLELRRKPATTPADPLPANIALLMDTRQYPPAPVVRLKTGSWVRVGTPAHEQAVRSGLVAN